MLYGKYREVVAPLSFVIGKEKFSVIPVQFQFIRPHPWMDRGQARLWTIQCCNRVLWCKGNIQLVIISIAVVRDIVSRDHATQWSGIEGKTRGPNTDPWGKPRERSALEDKQSPSLIFWYLPVTYNLNQASTFSVTPNQSSSLFKRIVWSMVSKSAERSSKVNAVPWNCPWKTEYQCGS